MEKYLKRAKILLKISIYSLLGSLLLLLIAFFGGSYAIFFFSGIGGILFAFSFIVFILGVIYCSMANKISKNIDTEAPHNLSTDIHVIKRLSYIALILVVINALILWLDLSFALIA